MIATFENNVLAVNVGTFQSSISVKQIENTWNALTHFHDRRARIELADLGERLNAFADFVDGIKAAGGNVDEAEERFTRRGRKNARPSQIERVPFGAFGRRLAAALERKRQMGCKPDHFSPAMTHRI
jgi:hypothetical protein